MQVEYTNVYFASLLFTSCDLTSIGIKPLQTNLNGIMTNQIEIGLELLPCYGGSHIVNQH